LAIGLACFVPAVVILLSAVRAEAAETRPPPNFVIILSDDGGYADWGCYGSQEFRTPNVDRLAREGMRFTQAYVAASICGPSRAALLTGRYPHRFGYEYNNVPPAMSANSRFTGNEMGLPLDETTLADALRPLGYRNLIVGKWHQGLADRFHPLRRGFDRFYGFRGGSRSYLRMNNPKLPLERRLWQDDTPVAEPAEGEYLTDLFTDRAIEFMRESKEQPFFLYLAYNAVHGPLETRPEDARAYAHLPDPRRRTLGGMTAALDRGVGRVLDAIDQLGLARNTVVLFLNDNGGESGVIGADNGPLAGTKGTNYEGGVRVPFLLRWPGVVSAGNDYALPVSALDVFPTFLAAAGGSAATLKSPLDGVDLRPFLTGTAPAARPHESLFWRKGPHAAVRHGDWKLLRHPHRPAELFDLAADVGEQTDLAAQRPQLVRDLFTRLWNWEKDQPRPAWMEERMYDFDAVERMNEFRVPGAVHRSAAKKGP
jgi:arylsulfatase A-like enzyme